MPAGSRIAKKPKIKAFLSKSSTLWFLFLFNGGVAVVSYLTTDGVKGIANRRKPSTARHRAWNRGRYTPTVTT